MAKRFTDSTKWSKPFIRSMKAPYKLLWLYILDECDHAGIWQVDFEVAQVKIGERLNLETALEQLKGKIYPFADGEKWFIPDFIDFQYGVLNPENRAHNSVIQLLNKYNLSLENKPLTSPLQGAMDIDKDKDKDMVKETATLKTFKPPTWNEVANYIWNKVVSEGKKPDKNKIKTVAESLVDFYQSKGWIVGKVKMKDWKAATNNWIRDKDVLAETIQERKFLGEE